MLLQELQKLFKDEENTKCRNLFTVPPFSAQMTVAWQMTLATGRQNVPVNLK